MKKRLRLLAWVLSLAMLCQMLPFAAFAETEGSTEKSTFHITDVDGLNYIRNDLDANYVLDNDIDLSGINWEPIGTLEKPFTGSFDGNGHTIRGLTITSYTPEKDDLYIKKTTYIGLFGYTSASFSNLYLTDVNISLTCSGAVNIGSLAGLAKHVENCVAYGTITATPPSETEINIGGIIARLYTGAGSFTISNCQNHVDITIPSANGIVLCGGIVGTPRGTHGDGDLTFSRGNAIINCDNYGSISLEEVTPVGVLASYHRIYIGGIFGYADNSASADSCRNYGELSINKIDQGQGYQTISGIGTVERYYLNFNFVISNSINYANLAAYNAIPNTRVFGIGLAPINNCYNTASNIINTVGNVARIGPNTNVGGDIHTKDCYSLNTSCINGEVPTKYAISGDRNGENLTKEEISAKIKEIFPNDDPLPDFDSNPDSKDFNFKRDAFSFINSSSSERYAPYNITAGFSKGKYRISDKSLSLLLYKLSPIAKSKVKFEMGKDWAGSCYGMSSIIALHYASPDSIPLSSFDFKDSSAISLYNLSTPSVSSSNEDLINYYHMLQYLPSLTGFLSERKQYCVTHTADAISQIIENLREDRPVLVSVKSHALLLLSVAGEDDSSYTINVYDPNRPDRAQLKLMKDSSSEKIKIDYTSTIPNVPSAPSNHYDTIYWYILSQGNDLKYLDLRNYFGKSDHETQATWPDISVDFNGLLNATVKIDNVTLVIKNGEVVSCSPYINYFLQYSMNDTLDGEPSEPMRSLYFEKQNSSSTVEMDITSSDNNTTFLLNDTFLSLSTSGPVKLTYNEAERTIDVTADEKTDVNLLFTQNDTSEAWPWHSWAIDTTGTTKFHAELDDDGLHLSGDGIANAKVGTENMDSETTSTVTLPAKAEGSDTLEVTVTSKKDTSDKDTLTINGAEPSEPTDPKPADPNPDKPSSPSTPAAPSGGSGDGDGSGAGALLLVGAGAAAAAITAGIVLSMPVEVQGKAELADHTALPGAKISLLQDGKVVEQTTADDAGAFALKVKRGNYQLTAAYTDANGQIIHQTIDIKAPAKDLVVTF